MREGWTYKKLGEVCDVLNGFAFKSNLYVDKGIRVIRITNVQKGFVSDNDPKYYPITEENKIKPYILKENDLLMSLTGNVGRVGLLKRDMLPAALNQRVACIRIREDSLSLKFLFYKLNSNDFENDCINNASGIAQKNMSTEWLKNVIIPIPIVNEQQQIVSELDMLSSVIEKQKAQIEELDKLAQSIFYDMFGDPVENEKGWEVKKIGDLASVKTGPFGSMLHKEDYISNGIPLVNPMHMKDFQVVADMDFTISEDKANELSNYILQKNDIIFARRGDIGRCAVISEKEEGYLCGTGSLYVRFVGDIASVYIMYIVRSDSFTQELVSKARGATMLNLNSNTIADLCITLPPLSLQQEFADKIEAIEAMKAKVRQSLKESEMLFNSRMDYYFN